MRDRAPQSDDRRRELERLVEQYVERLHRGESIDPMEVLESHPDLAADVLRELDTYESLTAVSAEIEAETELGSLGDYTLRRQIGRGGMGVVYDAWENSMGRAVALKVLPAGVAADDRAFQRFMQEARTAGKLSHPNVVAVHATGQVDNTPYFAMELVEGETLAQILGKIKVAEPDTPTPFGPKDRQDFFIRLGAAFADVADGLRHAHSKGVTHRDVKPSNLILDGDGRLRILDFGLARLEGEESLTFSGELLGTPLYMSPEQARRKRVLVDHRTDVYSLGATLYEAICDRPPFRGKDHADTLSRIIEWDPVEPRRLSPRVPRDLETIVLKCLRKDSSDRYGTAEALAQDLRRFVRGEVIEARPRSRWETVRARLWRHRLRVAVATGFLLLTTALVVLFVEHGRSSKARRAQKYESEIAAWRDSPAVAGLASFERIGLEPRSFPKGERVPGGSSTEAELSEIFRPIDKIIADLPERPEAYYYRARTNARIGRRDEAAADIRHLQSPDFVPADLFAANLAWDAGRIDEAQRILEGVAQRADERWEKLLVRAYQHLAAKDRQAAVATFDELLALQREEGRAYYVGADREFRLARGYLLLSAGNFGGALRDAHTSSVFCRGTNCLPFSWRPPLSTFREIAPRPQRHSRASSSARLVEVTEATWRTPPARCSGTSAS